MATAAHPPENPRQSLRRLVFHSLLTGLCPLIPIPLVDDWARDLLRRRLVGELVRRQGVELASVDVKVLALGERALTTQGCLRGCLVLTIVKPLFKIAIKIVSKLFRKVLVVLAVREGVLTFSTTFHEAYLVRHALGLGVLSGTQPATLEVRRAIEAAIAEPDHRPIEKLAQRTMRGSWQRIRRAARVLTGMMRRQRRSGRDDEEIVRDLDFEEEEQVLGTLVDQLTEEIEKKDGYLRHLEGLLEKHLPDRGRRAEKMS